LPWLIRSSCTIADNISYMDFDWLSRSSCTFADDIGYMDWIGLDVHRAYGYVEHMDVYLSIAIVYVSNYIYGIIMIFYVHL
jgi:hypothetical protein